jgi:hypothetical protein
VLFILNKAYYITNIEINAKIKMENIYVLDMWILSIKFEQKHLAIIILALRKIKF